MIQCFHFYFTNQWLLQDLREAASDFFSICIKGFVDLVSMTYEYIHSVINMANILRFNQNQLCNH